MTRIPLPRQTPVRVLTTAVAGALVAALLIVTGPLRHDAVSLAAAANNPVTPGNFYGYGFDQCETPSQTAMNGWLANSPYLAVGVYISGADRHCKDQPNLTPTWVHTQLTKGWRLMPIDLGPQSTCNSRFNGVAQIKTNSANSYLAAANQAIAEVKSAVAAAQRLGIPPGSTLFYDLESFTESNATCRSAALRFLSRWTNDLHKDGYLSGVYSSGSSGIKALNDARNNSAYTMPDQIWIAQWNGTVGTSSSYVAANAWMPDARVKQYKGGHVEKWGKISIDIDNDFLDLGKGTVAPADVHCGGIPISLPSYPGFGAVGAKPVPKAATVKAVKCLLQEQGFYHQKKINGLYRKGTVTAIEAFEKAHGFPVAALWNRRDWVAALSAGNHKTVKYGSGSADVYDLQRALNAATPGLGLPMTGVYADLTRAAVTAYQKRMKIGQTGNGTPAVWNLLKAGKR